VCESVGRIVWESVSKNEDMRCLLAVNVYLIVLVTVAVVIIVVVVIVVVDFFYCCC
jgi:hypothetical protein